MSILFFMNRVDCLTNYYHTLNSAIYLVVDTIILNHETQFRKISKIFTLHHIGFIILICFNYIDYLEVEYLDSFLLNIALVGELCVLPLNIRWYLTKTNNKISLFYKLNNKLLLILYFLIRIIGYSYALYVLFTNQMYSGFIVCFPLVSMNYVWFVKLLYLK